MAKTHLATNKQEAIDFLLGCGDPLTDKYSRFWLAAAGVRRPRSMEEIQHIADIKKLRGVA
jgi:hypothetical protein